MGVILLGLKQVGATPVAPGFDSGFRTAGGCSTPAALCFRTDAGDLDVLVDLVVAVAGDTAGVWTARLDDGRPLHIVARDSLPGLWKLRIARYDTLPTLEKFSWPSGVRLEVGLSGANRIYVRDWRVFFGPHSHPPDSRGRAAWRAFLFYLGLGLLIVVAAAAAMKPWTEAEPPPPAKPTLSQQIEAFLRRVVEEMEGEESESAEEMERMRVVLTKVLFQVTPATSAVASVAPELNAVQRAQYWFKTRSLFLKHLDRFIGRLQSVKDLLK